MYVCIRIYLYTLVLAVCPPIWPEVPASMPRSDSRNLSGKGSLLWGINGMRFSGRCFHSFEVSKFVRANQGSVGRRKKPAPRRDDSRGRDRRWAFENIADQKGCRSKTPGLHRLDFCWGRDRGRGRLAVAVEFFGILQNMAWSNRSDSRGGRSWQQKMYDFWQHQVLWWHGRRFIKRKHTPHKRWLPEKIIKHKQTSGVCGQTSFGFPLGFWMVFRHEDRYNIDEAAQRKLGMLPPEQADTLLRSSSWNIFAALPLHVEVDAGTGVFPSPWATMSPEAI